MDYRAAGANAKAIEELVPYLSKARAEMVQKTPKEDRDKMFGMMPRGSRRWDGVGRVARRSGRT